MLALGAEHARRAPDRERRHPPSGPRQRITAESLLRQSRGAGESRRPAGRLRQRTRSASRAFRPATLAALREWADEYVEEWRDRLNGCKVGSIAAEILKGGFSVQNDVATAFEQWRAALEAGLISIQDNGELPADADVKALSLVLLTSLQGGLLLTQASQDVAPLKAALDAAVEVVIRAGSSAVLGRTTD